MAVRLRELYEQARDYDIELIAGEAGMNHPVSWVHMVESGKIASFLEGGEIAFTTGVGLEDEDELLELIASVDRASASGMVINVGPYIKSIPLAAISYANEHQLPLFRVPWRVRMASIMHLFSRAIMQSEKSSMELAGALEAAITTPAQQDLYLGYLEQNGFAAAWNYCACVIELAAAERPQGHKRRDALRRAIESLATQFRWRLGMLSLDHRLVLVFANYDEARVQSMVRRIMGACRPLTREGETLRAGVGKITRSARCIGKSYDQARRLLKLLPADRTGTASDRAEVEPDTLFYEQTGIYKLLLAIDDTEIIRDYVQEAIGALIEHDRGSSAPLVPVLASYLAHSGSLQQTADALFVHRNTVSYRLKRAEQILDCDLSDFSTRERLSMAIRAQRLLD